jgi:hypothetical protein
MYQEKSGNPATFLHNFDRQNVSFQIANIKTTKEKIYLS